MRGLWPSLESLPGQAAVMVDWDRHLGDELEPARHFLRPTGEASGSYPCTHGSGCGCIHQVFPAGKYVGLSATCDCGECLPIELEPRDVIVFGLDVGKLGAAIRAALGFEAGSSVAAGMVAHSHAVGVHGSTRTPVFLTFPISQGMLMREIEALIGVVAGPFILLVPTPFHCTAQIEGLLRRNFCGLIALSTALALDANGKLMVTTPVDGALAEFDRALATRGGGLVKTVEQIHRNIDLVAKQNQELRAAKARLETMQAEGLFAFTSKIDHTALEQFFAVLASGDVAKASRDLGMRDSTLRSVIARWKRRGKAYAALAEFVRWRKSMKGQAGAEFAKRLASGGERETDYPALIRDVLEELEAFNPTNWAEKCEELGELLRGVG